MSFWMSASVEVPGTSELPSKDAQPTRKSTLAAAIHARKGRRGIVIIARSMLRPFSRPALRRCWNCGSPIGARERFCPRCSARQRDPQRSKP
jgi:hypothetical protein